MELMIQKALVERNETKRTTPQPTNHDQPPVKTSWFSFGRRRANQGWIKLLRKSFNLFVDSE